MNSSLLNLPPQSVQHLSGNVIFYYGAEPEGLQLLPTDAQFTLVYSPNGDDGWQSVRYGVIENRKGYSVLERRALDADEISYFERLMGVM